MSIKMHAAVYYSNNDVRLEEMPKPGIGRGEVLVKVMASGICGSDVMEWYRVKTAPRVLGHEITGEIVEIGDGVEDYKVGGRVFVSHHVPCNQCRYCKSGHHTACETLHKTNFDPGGFAQYVRVPEINVRHGILLLPDDMSYEDGTFIEPLGCVFRGQRLAEMRKGQSVLVLGSGISGLLHVKLARAQGAKRIIAADINEYRLEKALEFGADDAINAKEGVSEKADLVIVCTGALSAAKQALKCVDRGGTILFFAVPKPGIDLEVPVNDFWRNEIAIKTSYAAAPGDLENALKLITGGKVKVHDMITHRLGLEEAGLGFKLVADAGESIKVIIEPQR